MNDRGSNLALDIVTDDRKMSLLKPPPPFGIGGNEYGNAVDEGAARLDCPFNIELGRPLGAHRQIRYHDVGAGLRQNLRDVCLRGFRFDDLLAQIAADPVERGSTANNDA